MSRALRAFAGGGGESMKSVWIGGCMITALALGPTAWAQPAGATTEDEIVVTATRTSKTLLETPAAVTVQSLDELRSKGFTYGTDELRGVPGVFFRRGEGDGEEFPFVSIRGVTGNHGNDTFLALLDGIPFVGPDEEVLLYEVPYAAVENVDIVRGPVSALYGRGAIAGAVNYRTRSPSANETRASVGVGSDEYRRAEASLERRLDNGLGILLSASYEDFQGWRANSARETLTLFGKAELPIDAASTLTAYLVYTDRQAQVPGAIPTRRDGTPIDVGVGVDGFLGFGEPRNDSEGVIGALRYERALTDTLDLTVTAQARRFESVKTLNFYDAFLFDPSRSIMGVNGFKSPNDTNVALGEAVVEWRPGRHTIVAGVTAERATIDERDLWSGENDPFFDGSCNFNFYAILIDYRTGRVVNDGADNTCFVRDETLTANEAVNAFYGVFVQDEIALTDRWTLTLGARWDRFERDADFTVVSRRPRTPPLNVTGESDAFSPKAALGYDYGDGFVYASYGRGFNSNFGPLWQWDPGQYARDERPTTIDSIELGWKGRAFDGALQWETAIFALEQKDRRIFVPNPQPGGPSTLATTGQLYSSRGFEGSVQVRPTERTQLAATYTYLDPQWDELLIRGTFGAPDADFSGRTPQGVPEHILHLEASHDVTAWLTARASYEWYGDYFVDLSNSVRAGQFDLLNLSATLRLPDSDRVALDLSATNVLDEDYFFLFAGSRTAATHASPGVPRQVRATLRTRF